MGLFFFCFFLFFLFGIVLDLVDFKYGAREEGACWNCFSPLRCGVPTEATPQQRRRQQRRGEQCHSNGNAMATAMARDNRLKTPVINSYKQEKPNDIHEMPGNDGLALFHSSVFRILPSPLLYTST